MAKTGKSLEQLIDEVYAIVGPFAFERNDMHIEESKKQQIIAECKKGSFTLFGKYKVQSTETMKQMIPYTLQITSAVGRRNFTRSRKNSKPATNSGLQPTTRHKV